METSEEVVCVAIGSGMIFIAGWRWLVRREVLLSDIILISWGIPFLFGGLHLVYYSELNWSGVCWGVAFPAFMIAGIQTRSFFAMSGMSKSELISPPLISSTVVLRLISVLAIFGVLAKAYHNLVIVGLTVFSDFAAARSEVYTIEAAGTIWSRIGFLANLWPLPLAALVFYYRRLSVTDRVVYAVGGSVFALQGLLYAGRSPMLITVLFVVAVATARQHALGRIALHWKLAALGAGCAVVLFLFVLFGLRAYTVEQGGLYSQRYQLSDTMASFKKVVGENLLSEGMIGTIGYAGQPIQRLSEFFSLKIENRFYGAWLFEFTDETLRRLGLGHEVPPRSQLMQIYYFHNLNHATFATLARDAILNFGYAGALLFAFGLGVLVEHARRRVLQYADFRWAPVYGLLLPFAALSCLATFLAELPLYVAVAFAVLASTLFPPHRPGLLRQISRSGTGADSNMLHTGGRLYE